MSEKRSRAAPAGRRRGETRKRDEPRKRAEPPDRVLAKLREICLALPGAYETTTWGHPNFRAGKMIFSAFHEDRDDVPCIWIKVEPAAGALLHGDPRFTPSKHGGGRWVGLRANGAVDWKLARSLLTEAHALVAPKPAGKRRAVARKE